MQSAGPRDESQHLRQDLHDIDADADDIAPAVWAPCAGFDVHLGREMSCLVAGLAGLVESVGVDHRCRGPVVNERDQPRLDVRQEGAERQEHGAKARRDDVEDAAAASWAHA